MYVDASDARTVLSHDFEPQQVEQLLAVLAPAMEFKSIDADRLGGTRLGGSPDLPPHIDWPRPPPPADPDVIARRGNEAAGAMMRRHFSLDLPLAFLAQIDLAEAAALGAVAAPLPSEGRLLLFYDYLVGAWDCGTRITRVIWDRSPTAMLNRRAMPADLAAEDAYQRAEIEQVLAHSRYRSEGTPYGGPAQPKRLEVVWRLPDPHGLDADIVPGLKWRPRRGDELSPFEEAYADLLGEFTSLLAAHPRLSHQLLGYPFQKWQDPRLDAVIATRFGLPCLSARRWEAAFPAIKAEAHDWQLLLQTAICDWMQADLVEGMVYFMIRKADLAARHFDEVVAVYQQT